MINQFWHLCLIILAISTCNTNDVYCCCLLLWKRTGDHVKVGKKILSCFEHSSYLVGLGGCSHFKMYTWFIFLSYFFPGLQDPFDSPKGKTCQKALILHRCSGLQKSRLSTPPPLFLSSIHLLFHGAAIPQQWVMRVIDGSEASLTLQAHLSWSSSLPVLLSNSNPEHCLKKKNRLNGDCLMKGSSLPQAWQREQILCSSATATASVVCTKNILGSKIWQTRTETGADRRIYHGICGKHVLKCQFVMKKSVATKSLLFLKRQGLKLFIEMAIKKKH